MKNTRKIHRERLAMIQELTPPWAQSIAYAEGWGDELRKALPLKHLALKEYTKVSENESFGEGDYDALYLSPSSIPKSVQDFISLFNKLKAGAVLFLDCSLKQWSYNEIKKIAASLGARILFPALESPPMDHFKGKGNSKIIVLQKKVFLNQGRKRVSVLIPIFSSQKMKPRVLQWIQFLEAMDLTPFVELLLVFDGIHDLLPAWKECEALEEEASLRILRHYKSFGSLECMRSAFYFARGKYLLWDSSTLPCSEFFSIFDLVPKKNLESPIGVLAKAWASDSKSAKRIGTAFPVPFFLLNRPAAEILYWERDYKEEAYKKSETREEDKGEEILSHVQNILKKERVKINYAELTSSPS